ncbi:MAG: hypothetical protein JWM02_1280 [Frankiales bacterium]|nr:hypothetical protein [Frankiales bacterium]
MAVVNCVDGSVLTVLPVPVRDRDGAPYEVTLRLLRNGQPFGEVGERCGYFLASTAARLRAARAGDEQFPTSSLEGGLRAWATDAGEEPDAVWEVLQRYLPRDRELFCFRARDPDDLSTVGELRASLQIASQWTAAGWSMRCLAVLEAWGERGQGVRAMLDSTALLAFLESLVQDFAAVGATYEASEDGSGLRRPVG